MIYIEDTFSRRPGFLNFITTWKMRYQISTDTTMRREGALLIKKVKDPKEIPYFKDAILILQHKEDSKNEFFSLKTRNEEFLIYATVTKKEHRGCGRVIGKICQNGEERADIIWDSQNNLIILPFDPFSAIENFLYEKYLKQKNTYFNPWLFYANKIFGKKVKNFLAGVRYKFDYRRTAFPDWPIDASLFKIYDFLLQAIAFLMRDKYLEFIWFWPRPFRSTLLISHDVDPPVLINTAEEIEEAEKNLHLKSTWFFVADFNKYGKQSNKICALISGLVDNGFEIASHGLRHDGMLFESEEHFLEEIRMSKERLKILDLDIHGFRAQHLLRQIDWMGEIGRYYDYDSSYMDTSNRSLYAERSGCLSFYPFFISNLLEIPITIPLDYQLFVYSQLDFFQCRGILEEKTDFLIKRDGLISFLVHPELAGNKQILDFYILFFKDLASRREIWNPTFSELSKWWRERGEADFCDFNREQIEIYRYRDGYFV